MKYDMIYTRGGQKVLQLSILVLLDCKTSWKSIHQ